MSIAQPFSPTFQKASFNSILLQKKKKYLSQQFVTEIIPNKTNKQHFNTTTLNKHMIVQNPNEIE